MNLTWHIIKKDLRALRWPLFLWTLLIVMKLGAGALLLTADGTEGDRWMLSLDAAAKILAALEVLSFILVAALVQEDPLVGTTAFWVTRPISGGRLLRAKLLMIGLCFIVWPLLVTLPWWLACGYGLREIVGAAAETAAIHFVVVLVGLLWATVTDGFGRFFLWTLVALVAVMAVFAWIGVHLAGLSVKPEEEVVWTRLLIVIVLALIGLVAVVINQFLSRHTVRSLVMINVAMLLMVSIGMWWPWSLGLQSWWQGFVMRQLESDWPASARPPGFEITMQQAELLRMVNSKPDRPVQLRVDCRVQGLPADQALIPSLANQFTLRWADGQTKRGWSWVRSQSDWYDRVSMPVLGITSVNAGGPVLPKIYQMLPATVADRLQAEPADFTMKSQFAIMELESTTKVPLEPGPRIRRGSTGERIAHLDRVGEQLQVTYVRHHPVFLSDILGGVVYMLGVRQANIGWFPQYLLVNRSRNHVDRGQWLTRYKTCIATVEITQDTMAYRALPRVKGKRPTLEAVKAIDEAELVRMTYRERARFTSELKVPSLVVEPPVIPSSAN